MRIMYLVNTGSICPYKVPPSIYSPVTYEGISNTFIGLDLSMTANKPSGEGSCHLENGVVLVLVSLSISILDSVANRVDDSNVGRICPRSNYRISVCS